MRSMNRNGSISASAAISGQCQTCQIDHEGHHGGDHHGAGDGDAVGRGERARRAEQRHQQQHADQQQRVDARHIDLPEQRFRGVADFQPRQQAELDRLPGERIGAGDDRLAGDHGGGGGKQHHRQQRPIGIKQEERIFDRLRIGQHQRALPEIVDGQRRQHHDKPGKADRRRGRNGQDRHRALPRRSRPGRRRRA